MRNPEIRRVKLFIPLLKNLPVTGNDVPPAIEGSSYGTEHLVFLGTQKGKLTGNIEILVDDIEKVIEIGDRIPLIELEVITQNSIFPVLLHRIKVITTQKKRQKKGDAR